MPHAQAPANPREHFPNTIRQPEDGARDTAQAVDGDLLSRQQQASTLPAASNADIYRPSQSNNNTDVVLAKNALIPPSDPTKSPSNNENGTDDQGNVASDGISSQSANSSETNETGARPAFQMTKHDQMKLLKRVTAEFRRKWNTVWCQADDGTIPDTNSTALTHAHRQGVRQAANVGHATGDAEGDVLEPPAASQNTNGLQGDVTQASAGALASENAELKDKIRRLLQENNELKNETRSLRQENGDLTRRVRYLELPRYVPPTFYEKPVPEDWMAMDPLAQVMEDKEQTDDDYEEDTHEPAPKKRPPPHTWTAHERHILHVASTEYELTWDQITAIYNYASGGSVTAKRVADEYRSRDHTGRSKVWKEQIVKNSYNSAERAQRRFARDDIKTATDKLGIPLVAKSSANTGDEEDSEDGGDGIEGGQDQGDSDDSGDFVE